jgi:neutral ceramidase
MKKSILLLFITAFLIFINLKAAETDQQAGVKSWKAGVARVKITPEEPTWMAGYGSRDHPSEGILVDLWAKALALEDAKGKKVVLVTTDLLGFPQKMSYRIRDRIGAKFGLTRAQIILSSSHTHSGPVVGEALSDVYPMNAQQKEVVKKYTADLENKIVTLVGEAIRTMVPAQLYSQNGVTRFQVNRRNNKEANINQITDLAGPNDYAVPVLKVTNGAGDLLAVTFGYACHATCLSIYQFSGDYPGFAQIEIEKLHPGITAMFFQGAGADQNPLPRRTVQLAQQYGRELAAAVDRVLNEDMKKLEPVISTAYSEIPLKLSKAPTKEELIKMENEFKDSQKRWAQSQLETLRKNGSLPTSYPYPVQIWKLGEQSLMTLGGELVVQYAIELKKMFGQDIFVMGYANDEMAYIPSDVVLQEGGYEGDTSQKVYGMPSKWETGIQSNILSEFEKLALKAGVQKVAK